MTKKPNLAHALALATADAARRNAVEDDISVGEDADVLFEEQSKPQSVGVAQPIVEVAPVQGAEVPVEGPSSPPRRGRPRGKRPVEARQTIYLDKARHAALARIAEDRGRSVHSLILEGIDYVIQKPAKPGWQ